MTSSNGVVVKDADLAGNASLGLAVDARRNRLLVSVSNLIGNQYSGLAGYDMSAWLRIFLTQLSSPPGACGSGPSSTTTMQMGIERVLKEKFGEAAKEIRQVFDEETSETTAEAVNRHFDILRPAISNYSGSVEVLKRSNRVSNPFVL